jgi:hypothetical protein
MFQFSLAEKVLTYGEKIWKYRENRKAEQLAKDEEAEMLQAFDDLRRSILANGRNVLIAEIGSPKDRLYSKMVTKGYLVRTHPYGYMLRQTAQQIDYAYPHADF